jgi:hypothetical protein
MNTATFANLEQELESAANLLSMSPEAEAATTNRVYFDSWTWTASGWQYLGRDGPFSMTKQQATGTIFTLQLKYRAKAQSLGGQTPFVQCFAYFPVSNRWVACQNWV